MAIPLKHDSRSTPQAEAPQQAERRRPQDERGQDSPREPRGSEKGQRRHGFKDRADK